MKKVTTMERTVGITAAGNIIGWLTINIAPWLSFFCLMGSFVFITMECYYLYKNKGLKR